MNLIRRFLPGILVTALLLPATSHAAIGFRSAQGSNNGSGGGNITMTMPSGVVNGDVLVMSVTAVGGTGTTITTPTGWTLLGSAINSTTALTQAIYWRVASGEPASYLVTLTSNKASGTIIAISGARSAVLVSAQYGGQANASSTTFAAPALGTWSSYNGMRLLFGGTAVGTTTSTVATGFTKGAESASTGGSASSRTTSAVQYKTDSAVTTEASVSATSFWSAGAVQVDHQVFVMEDHIPSVALNTANAANFTNGTPTLDFTGTDGDGDRVRYEIQIDTLNTFNSTTVTESDGSYSCTGNANIALYSGTGTNTGTAQSFASSAGTLVSAQFQLCKIGTPTGPIVAKLYASAGTFGTSSVPTGSALATSDSIDASTITATGCFTFEVVTFNFTGAQQVTLSAGTNYEISVEYNSGDSTDYTGVCQDTTGSAPGNESHYSGTWAAQSNIDQTFQVNIQTSGPLLDMMSNSGAGFADTANGGDSDPFISGNMASYTVQAANALSSGTYYWRVRAWDPSAENVVGSWSSIQNFTITSSSTTAPKHRVRNY